MTNQDPMPVFVLKGKDALAPGVVDYYRRECHRHGLIDQAKQVGLAFEEMAAWQRDNPERVKLPAHNHVPVGQDADSLVNALRIDAAELLADASSLDDLAQVFREGLHLVRVARETVSARQQGGGHGDD